MLFFILTGLLYEKEHNKSEKTLYGYVLDCENDQPIENATLTLTRTSWGLSWDGLYYNNNTLVSKTTTDRNGFFLLPYNKRVNQITVEKNNYIKGYFSDFNQNKIVIRIVSEDLNRDTPGRFIFSCDDYHK